MVATVSETEGATDYLARSVADFVKNLFVGRFGVRCDNEPSIGRRRCLTQSWWKVHRATAQRAMVTRPPQAKHPRGEGSQMDVQSGTVAGVTTAGTEDEDLAENFQGHEDVGELQDPLVDGAEADETIEAKQKTFDRTRRVRSDPNCNHVSLRTHCLCDINIFGCTESLQSRQRCRKMLCRAQIPCPGFPNRQ